MVVVQWHGPPGAWRGARWPCSGWCTGGAVVVGCRCGARGVPRRCSRPAAACLRLGAVEVGACGGGCPWWLRSAMGCTVGCIVGARWFCSGKGQKFVQRLAMGVQCGGVVDAAEGGDGFAVPVPGAGAVAVKRTGAAAPVVGAARRLSGRWGTWGVAAGGAALGGRCLHSPRSAGVCGGGTGALHRGGPHGVRGGHACGSASCVWAGGRTRHHARAVVLDDRLQQTVGRGARRRRHGRGVAGPGCGWVGRTIGYFICRSVLERGGWALAVVLWGPVAQQGDTLATPAPR
jgi:hypothetical protein